MKLILLFVCTDSFHALGVPAGEAGIDRTQFVEGQACKCLPDCDQTIYVQVKIEKCHLHCYKTHIICIGNRIS